MGLTSNLVRWGGLAGVVAGVMYVLQGVLSLLAPQQRVFDSSSDYLIEVIFVVALAGTLVVIAALHALLSGRYGLLGAVGSLITFVGYTLLFVAAAATTLAGREALDAVFPIGVLAILVGSIMLGAMTLRARVLPWWCSVLLIIGFPLSVALDVAVRGAGVARFPAWRSRGMEDARNPHTPFLSALRPSNRRRNTESGVRNELQVPKNRDTD